MGFIAIALLLSSRLIALTVNRSFPPYSAKYLILWCRNPDSNWGPTHYECVALPTELLRQSTISEFIQQLIDLSLPCIAPVQAPCGIKQGLTIDPWRAL